MAHSNKPRSHEPIVWLLFAAGGMLAAMLLPALVLITGIAGPLGLLSEDSLDYARVHGFISTIPGKLLLSTFVSLLFWHAMHRIFHGLHDLGINTQGRGYRMACYGFALLATLVTAGILFAL